MLSIKNMRFNFLALILVLLFSKNAQGVIYFKGFYNGTYADDVELKDVKVGELDGFKIKNIGSKLKHKFSSTGGGLAAGLNLGSVWIELEKILPQTIKAEDAKILFKDAKIDTVDAAKYLFNNIDKKTSNKFVDNNSTFLA